MVIAQSNNSGAQGLLEIIGSGAPVSIGRLENHNGANNNETIRWVADAGGISTLNVTNSGGNRLQLQSGSEETANTGTDMDIIGNGTALELDLSAFTGSGILVLINNTQGGAGARQGFFEDGTSLNLYCQGEEILDTGYNGTVTISYTGHAVNSTFTGGNDVVLNLAPSVTEDADFDQDGDIDGADFLTWQRNLQTANPTPAQGDADDDDDVDGDDLAIWEGQFDSSVVASAPVPEPGSFVMFASLAGLIVAAGARRAKHAA
jgi:hypothetical protein